MVDLAIPKDSIIKNISNLMLYLPLPLQGAMRVNVGLHLTDNETASTLGEAMRNSEKTNTHLVKFMIIKRYFST